MVNPLSQTTPEGEEIVVIQEIYFSKHEPRIRILLDKKENKRYLMTYLQGAEIQTNTTITCLD